MRVTKFLVAGVTLFCVSWIASVNEWHAGVRWSRRVDRRFTTMRTIVAYSEGKQAEMERPSPLACERLPVFPEIPQIVSIFKLLFLSPLILLSEQTTLLII